MNTPSRVVPSSEAALRTVSAGARDHRQEAKGQGEKNTQCRLMRERPGQPLRTEALYEPRHRCPIEEHPQAPERSLRQIRHPVAQRRRGHEQDDDLVQATPSLAAPLPTAHRYAGWAPPAFRLLRRFSPQHRRGSSAASSVGAPLLKPGRRSNG